MDSTREKVNENISKQNHNNKNVQHSIYDKIQDKTKFRGSTEFMIKYKTRSSLGASCNHSLLNGFMQIGYWLIWKEKKKSQQTARTAIVIVPKLREIDFKSNQQSNSSWIRVRENTLDSIASKFNRSL